MLVLFWAFVVMAAATIITGSARTGFATGILALFIGYLIYTGVYN